MPPRMSMSPMAIIVAVDEIGGFGKDGKIPWHFPEDLKHFQETTKGHVCVMGRRTYTDMLEMRQERDAKNNKTGVIDQILPGRDSYVVTSNPDFKAPGATVVRYIREAVQSLDESDKRTVFIIGGFRMFVEALSTVDTIYMTVVEGTYNCDVSFPLQTLNKNFEIVEGSEQDKLRFITYKRVR